MIKLIAGIVLSLLLLTGCAGETKEVTPDSCLRALDSASQAFGYIGDGNVQEFIEWAERNSDSIRRDTADCRSKAEPSQST